MCPRLWFINYLLMIYYVINSNYTHARTHARPHTHDLPEGPIMPLFFLICANRAALKNSMLLNCAYHE